MTRVDALPRFGYLCRNIISMISSFTVRSRGGVALIVPLILFFLSSATGQIPAGYYDPADGKTGLELQAALHEIIKNHTVKSYDYLWTAFQTTDDKPNGTVWDMYSDIPDGSPNGNPPYSYQFGLNQCGNYNSEGDCYNREHSWPKSWFNDLAPMNSDMFHIYPTDGYVNNKRDNYPYGTVTTATWTSMNGSKLGACTWPGYSGTVFEPTDAYKGDFARSYFYMSTRYYSEDAGWDVTDMTNKSQLKPWALQMMLHWNNADPVSPKETDRNNTVYGFQNNRNPFIDHPEFAALIWGDPVSAADQQATDQILKVWPNPVNEVCKVVTGENIIEKNLTITLCSVAGQTVHPDYYFQDQSLTLRLPGLPRGIYILQILVEGEPGPRHGLVVKQ